MSGNLFQVDLPATKHQLAPQIGTMFRGYTENGIFVSFAKDLSKYLKA